MRRFSTDLKVCLILSFCFFFVFIDFFGGGGRQKVKANCCEKMKNSIYEILKTKDGDERWKRNEKKKEKKTCLDAACVCVTS